MGYRITLVLHIPFDNSATFDGQVAFAKRTLSQIRDIVALSGEHAYEYYDEEDWAVSIHIEDYYWLNFFEDSFEISTSDDWSTFLMNDHLMDVSLRKVFQRILDRLNPEESWIGADYATDQGPTLENGYSVWKETIMKQEGPIEDFDFEKIKGGYLKGIHPRILYHVKDNLLFALG